MKTHKNLEAKKLEKNYSCDISNIDCFLVPCIFQMS